MQLAAKLVVVSGASSGIGAALAKSLGAAGARVVLIARRLEKLEAVAHAVREAGGEAHVVAADLATAEGAARAGAAALEIGVPDVLVNNAGAGDWKYVDETEPEEVVSLMALPYFASFWLTRALVEPMMARGSGAVLMVNSPAWMMGWPGATGYAAARAAQHAFAEGLREDVRHRGLVVSEVTLGEVSSEYFAVHSASHERLPTVAKKLMGVITPERAAAVLMRALSRRSERVMAPFMLGVIFRCYQWFPSLVRWLVRATSHKRDAG